MRLLVILVICITVLNGGTLEKYMKQLETLDYTQQDVLINAYKAGEPYGYGLILAVIAWKESYFGKWPINLSDGKYGSYGVYHIRLDYAMARKKITSAWDRSRYAEELLYDFDSSSLEAIALISHWMNYYKKDKDRVKKVFASYNGGYKLSAQALSYADDCLLRMEAIRQYDIHKKYNLIASNDVY